MSDVIYSSQTASKNMTGTRVRREGQNCKQEAGESFRQESQHTKCVSEVMLP